MAEYSRSFDDELDWNLLEQLHKVVLQISTFCFRTKQVCLTIDIAVMGLLVKFTDGKLDPSLFVAGLVIPVAFWFLDGVAYYYQVKIRGVMDRILEELKSRNREPLIEHVSQHAIIDAERVEGTQAERLRDAFFNHSMWMYLLLVLSDMILWAVFFQGEIG